MGLEAGTLAAISIALTAVSTGASIYAQTEAADAQSKAQDYNKKLAENQAQQASMNANAEADQQRSRNRRLLAAQRSSILKNGATLSGSAIDLQNDSAVQGELDALSTLYTGRVQAGYYQSAAQQAQQRKDSINSALPIAIGGTLLSGSASAAGTYAKNPSFGGYTPQGETGSGSEG